MSAPPRQQTSTPAGVRTSPLVVLVHTITFRQARRFAGTFLPLAAAIGIQGGSTTAVVVIGVVAVVSVVTAALSWWRFSYADGPASVVVTRGLLSRSVRTVPNDRVRGVEVETPALHRVFGLVRVRIDAAAGAVKDDDEELVVDGVTRAEGDRLRVSVLTHRAGPDPTGDDGAVGTPVEEEFTRFDNRWLLYAPLVGSYLALPLAVAGALYRTVDDLPDSVLPALPGPDLAHPGVLALLAGIAVVLLLLGSVVGAALVNWGFLLVRRGGSLIAVRGLVTRRHTELEIDRIRGATVSAGLGMRLVRAARVNALMTGLGDAGRRGQLLPLGPSSEAWRLARRLVDDPGPLVPHPPAARRRRLGRALFPGLLVTAAGLVGLTVGWWELLVAGVVLLAVGVPLGLGRYAALGHATGPRSFAVRSGFLVEQHAILQRRAVVGWQVRQTFFQRRAGLATAVACVGAGSGGYAAVDLGAGDVAAFTAAASEPWAETLSPTAS
ncbi:MAG: PH domain-containing protein [Blastococcus sp.]